MCGFCSERFPLPLVTWDRLRYFIVVLPEPSIYIIILFGLQVLELKKKAENILLLKRFVLSDMFINIISTTLIGS